jgi:membrane-associated PAP2 superfamily phosphatase
MCRCGMASAGLVGVQLLFLVEAKMQMLARCALCVDMAMAMMVTVGNKSVGDKGGESHVVYELGFAGSTLWGAVL